MTESAKLPSTAASVKPVPTPSDTESLHARDDGSPVLQSVSLDGRLDGLVLTMRVRQSYRNDAAQDIEAVYTFPLAHDAVLLGLAAELGDRRLSGAVVEKKDAVERYEQAVSDGDTPVMVRRVSAGLYTANLGNLRPGEEAVIELTYAQCMRYEQGRIRLVVPTVIAPRYGDAQGHGGLQPHESVDPDARAEYPLALRLTLHGGIAQGVVASPSHAIETRAGQDMVEVRLSQRAWLDRDFVLTVGGLAQAAHALYGTDGEQTMVMASFCPEWDAPPQRERPLRLKLLVDGSGSMAGDSVMQARQALGAVGELLNPDDLVSFTRFGSQPRHEIAALTPCTPAWMSGVFQPAIARTEADLGGTEMHRALDEVVRIGAGENPDGAADVLLITDGEVWNIEPLVALARRSGHRIFAIGVGSAPAESLLRELADATGGACELVSPHEDMAAAVLRMFHRLRQGRRVDLSVDWGLAPAWQSPLPPVLVPGDTVHVFALLDAVRPALAPRLRWTADGQTHETPSALAQADPSGTVARLGGARRLMAAADEAQARELALRYQLVSEHTHLLLVHERSAGDKAQGLPSLRQVPQMLAAGWGGAASVLAGPVFSMASVRVSDAGDAGSVLYDGEGVDDFLEPPAFLRRADGAARPPWHLSALTALVPEVNRMASSGVAFDAIVAMLNGRCAGLAGVAELLRQLTDLLGDRRRAWAGLLLWLHERQPQAAALDRHARRLVVHLMPSLPPDCVAVIEAGAQP